MNEFIQKTLICLSFQLSTPMFFDENGWYVSKSCDWQVSVWAPVDSTLVGGVCTGDGDGQGVAGNTTS